MTISRLADGYGYEIASMEVREACASTMKAADRAGCGIETLERIRRLLARATYGSPVVQVIGRKLQIPAHGSRLGPP